MKLGQDFDPVTRPDLVVECFEAICVIGPYLDKKQYLNDVKSRNLIRGFGFL